MHLHARRLVGYDHAILRGDEALLVAIVRVDAALSYLALTPDEVHAHAERWSRLQGSVATPMSPSGSSIDIYVASDRLTADTAQVEDDMGEGNAVLPREAAVSEESAEREHASDRVFRAIAAAILNRELTPEAPLPPERELSDRFGVSRIVVREAIHRLKEYELVRVRQGSPTMVLDPDRATDMRLLGLEIELMPPTAENLASFAERQIYSGAALLDLAEQRIDPPQIDELEAITEKLAMVPDLNQEWLTLERAYWTVIALGAKNRLYVRETAWYFNLLEHQPRFRSVYTVLPANRAAFYRRLNEKIRARQGSAAMYLEMLRESPPSSMR